MKKVNRNFGKKLMLMAGSLIALTLMMVIYTMTNSMELSAVSIAVVPIFGSFEAGTFRALNKTEIDSLEVEELAKYYNEENLYNNKVFLDKQEALLEGKATKAEVEMLSKTINEIREGQFKQLNKKLLDMGLEIAKFKKGDGKTKVAVGEQVMANLKDRLADLTLLKNKDKSVQGMSFEVEKAVGTITSGNITGQLPVVDMISGIETIATRKTFIKNVLKKGTILGNTLAWVDQANREGAAGSTAEGVKKNQIDFDIVVRTSDLVKYTAFIKVSQEMVDDIAFMAGEINNELLVMLDLAIDDALLVLIQAASTAYAAGDFALAVPTPTTVDLLLTVKNQIKLANGEATHVLLNPTDVTFIKLEKDSTGQPLKGVYVDKDVMMIDNLVVIENSGITKDNFLMFDNSKGTVYTKSMKKIDIGRENDDFTKNLLTVLAESRDLLVIKENNKTSFVKGVISTGKTAITKAVV